jgi:hypothetical protein
MHELRSTLSDELPLAPDDTARTREQFRHRCGTTYHGD